MNGVALTVHVNTLCLLYRLNHTHHVQFAMTNVCFDYAGEILIAYGVQSWVLNFAIIAFVDYV